VSPSPTATSCWPATPSNSSNLTRRSTHQPIRSSNMFTPAELHGLNAMMPAFAKEGATSLTAVDTIDVDNLNSAVDRIIKDGVNVISTTGSYGELSTLLWDEMQTLFKATLDVVNKRVPLFFGVTSWNGREVVRKARFVRDIGGEGIFVGVPFYYTPT